ncbi:MAG: hypothetical protein APF84_11150 [Gracilibacter sp. BRH_c7a]|nr:MAG: hypothetical protein APF84_11150 [Gracilibacter sp. BRH_c7a]
MKILFAFYDEVPEWAVLSSEFPDVKIFFAKDIEEVSKQITDTNALFILAPRYTSDVADIVKAKAKNLQWIQTTTVGVDELIRYGTPSGVVITKAVGIFDTNVAEQAMGLLLAIIRQVAAAESDKQKHQYNREQLWERTSSLERKNVGIIGYGGIGKQVSKRAKAFNTHILVYDVIAGVEDSNVDEFFLPGQFQDFLAKCDIVILTLPLTSENLYMFDRDTFKLMKKSSILINVSRGKLVRETALIEALDRGIIAGAGLDVFEEEPLSNISELWKVKNFVMTPHLGGQGDYNPQRLADLFRININKFLHGDELKYVVDVDKGF